MFVGYVDINGEVPKLEQSVLNVEPKSAYLANKSNLAPPVA